MESQENTNPVVNIIPAARPDVTGWNVRNGSGEKIGEISDVLTTPGNHRLLYLVVALSAEPARNAGRKVLLPIGLAEIHRADDEVIVPGIFNEQLAALPGYEPGNLTPVQEAQIRSILTGTAVGDAIAHTGDDFYHHQHFNDLQFYAHRMAKVPVAENRDSGAAVTEVLMDYEDAASAIDAPLASPMTGPTGEFVDNDREEGGLDISKYTGPDSKASTQFGAGDPGTFTAEPSSPT